MSDATPLNVPPPVITAPNPTPLAGVPATLEVDAPAVATPDLLRTEGRADGVQTPSTPEGPPAAQTLATALANDSQGAAPPSLPPIGQPGVPSQATTQVPVPPPVSAGMTPSGAGTAAIPVGVPATPGIISSTSPVPVGNPTLATTGPAQGSNAPRIAGVQMVPPTPPAVQTASQLTQAQNAPQALAGISTMLQQS